MQNNQRREIVLVEPSPFNQFLMDNHPQMLPSIILLEEFLQSTYEVLLTQNLTGYIGEVYTATDNLTNDIDEDTPLFEAFKGYRTLVLDKVRTLIEILAENFQKKVWGYDFYQYAIDNFPEAKHEAIELVSNFLTTPDDELMSKHDFPDSMENIIILLENIGEGLEIEHKFIYEGFIMVVRRKIDHLMAVLQVEIDEAAALQANLMGYHANISVLLNRLRPDTYREKKPPTDEG